MEFNFVICLKEFDLIIMTVVGIATVTAQRIPFYGKHPRTCGAFGFISYPIGTALILYFHIVPPWCCVPFGVCCTCYVVVRRICPVQCTSTLLIESDIAIGTHPYLPVGIRVVALIEIESKVCRYIGILVVVSAGTSIPNSCVARQVRHPRRKGCVGIIARWCCFGFKGFEDHYVVYATT